jgi:hypothetical protein
MSEWVWRRSCDIYDTWEGWYCFAALRHDTSNDWKFCLLLFEVNASGGESVGSDAVLFELFEFPRDVRFLWSCLDRCPDALQNALSGARSSFSKMKMG